MRVADDGIADSTIAIVYRIKIIEDYVDRYNKNIVIRIDRRI